MPERRLEGRGGSATATPSVDEEPRKGRRGRKDSRCEDTGEQERAGRSGKRRVFRMGGAVPREEVRGWQDGARRGRGRRTEPGHCCRGGAVLPGQRITRRQRGRAAPQQPGHGGPTVLPAPQGARRAGRGGTGSTAGSRPCQSFGQRSVTTAQCCWKQSPARSENHWSNPIPLFHI